MATARYDISHLSAHNHLCRIHAYYDLGSSGRFWGALPDMLQPRGSVVTITTFTYTAEAFVLTVESYDTSAVTDIVAAMDGFMLKIVALVSPSRCTG